jgi:pyruvate/2-oxoglutarate dehydrogenase complex dihydrolipoamide dehydrogenase (E3) component
LLIEKEPALGGDCLHYGCVPSKTLIASARLYQRMKHAPRWGLPAPSLPGVSFAAIAARIRQVIDTIQSHDSPERFCRLGAMVRFGQAVFQDEHCVALDGQRLSARRWVIATGSSPLVPPIPGLEHTAFLTNRDLFSLPRLPASMIFLGAGPIGIEMAQAFHRLGAEVSVVDRADQILPREDRDMADAVQAALAAEGVRFHLGASIERVRELGASGRAVTLRDADGTRREIRAEALVLALGRRPNLDGLGLEAAGVVCGAGGIDVDARQRTSQRHIYAAGDVTGRYLFTHAAGYAGGIVLSNAIFRLPRRADWSRLPWCTYSEPELASIGLNETAARARGIDVGVWSESFAANDRALAEGEGPGRIKLLLDGAEKVLGVQILGPSAGELIAEWVAALAGGTRLTALAAAVHPYPTLAEITKRVAGNVVARKLFSERVRKGLAFFFSLKGRACSPAEGREEPP